MPADTPALPVPPAPRRAFGPYRVCFVCLGNICRSPMADVLLRAELAEAGLAELVEVDSAGTGDWHVGGPMDRRARAELGRHGYDGSAHRSRQFQPSWFADRDLVLAMDRANLADLREMAPDAEAGGPRLLLFRSFDPALAGDDPYDGQVPDPYGGPPDDYAAAFGLVQAAVRGLAGQLAGLLEAPAAPARGGDPPELSEGAGPEGTPLRGAPPRQRLGGR
ncbi:MAG TPA: low molecular weight protein-tyrosine-phosphatase [Streptosporangiaceae bacterium]